jgi:hypothetical protein
MSQYQVKFRSFEKDGTNMISWDQGKTNWKKVHEILNDVGNILSMGCGYSSSMECRRKQ